MLFFDDLQWADWGSLEFLFTLVVSSAGGFEKEGRLAWFQFGSFDTDQSIGKVLDEILDLLIVDGMDVVDVVGAHVLEGIEGGLDMIGSHCRWWLGAWENKVIQIKFLDWYEYNIILLY